MADFWVILFGGPRPLLRCPYLWTTTVVHDKGMINKWLEIKLCKYACACIRSFVHTCVRAYVRACIRACVHTCMQVYLFGVQHSTEVIHIFHFHIRMIVLLFSKSSDTVITVPLLSRSLGSRSLSFLHNKHNELTTSDNTWHHHTSLGLYPCLLCKYYKETMWLVLLCHNVFSFKLEEKTTTKKY